MPLKAHSTNEQICLEIPNQKQMGKKAQKQEPSILTQQNRTEEVTWLTEPLSPKCSTMGLKNKLDIPAEEFIFWGEEKVN